MVSNFILRQNTWLAHKKSPSLAGSDCMVPGILPPRAPGHARHPCQAADGPRGRRGGMKSRSLPAHAVFPFFLLRHDRICAPLLSFLVPTGMVLPLPPASAISGTGRSPACGSGRSSTAPRALRPSIPNAVAGDPEHAPKDPSRLQPTLHKDKPSDFLTAIFQPITDGTICGVGFVVECYSLW